MGTFGKGYGRTEEKEPGTLGPILGRTAMNRREDTCEVYRKAAQIPLANTVMSAFFSILTPHTPTLEALPVAA